VLSGLSNTKNMKYETAIRLNNLELENAKFTLEEIGKKFFSIDEKIACDQALTRLALGSAARSQHDHGHKRGSSRGYGAGRGTLEAPTNNRKSEHAHIASHSNSQSIICYNCGEPGHTAPKCPKPKQPNAVCYITAEGNTA
jgi:hypothetical protein